MTMLRNGQQEGGTILHLIIGVPLGIAQLIALLWFLGTRKPKVTSTTDTGPMFPPTTANTANQEDWSEE